MGDDEEPLDGCSLVVSVVLGGGALNYVAHRSGAGAAPQATPRAHSRSPPRAAKPRAYSMAHQKCRTAQVREFTPWRFACARQSHSGVCWKSNRRAILVNSPTSNKPGAPPGGIIADSDLPLAAIAIATDRDHQATVREGGSRRAAAQRSLPPPAHAPNPPHTVPTKPDMHVARPNRTELASCRSGPSSKMSPH